MGQLRPIAVAICSVLPFLPVLGVTPLVNASNPASLAAIALRPADLPGGARLVRQSTYKTYVRGYRSGQKWIFKTSHGAVREIVSIVVQYRNVTNAAQGAIIEGERQCGSKQSNFTYHPISPQVGDYATGCYYATGNYTKNTVIMVLRRFSYVAVVRVTGRRSLDYFHLTPLTTGYAARVDRRIEIAVHGTGLVGAPPRKPAKKGTKHSITLLSCNRGNGCFFRAQGQGSAHAGTSWSKMPRKWKFQPTSQFKVSYSFACRRYSSVSDGFEMFLRNDLNEVETLKGIGDARDSGTVSTLLSGGARKGALQIHVQNSTCKWYVKAFRFYNPHPQP